MSFMQRQVEKWNIRKPSQTQTRVQKKKKLSHFKTHLILKEYKYCVNRRNILLNLSFENYY